MKSIYFVLPLTVFILIIISIGIAFAYSELQPVTAINSQGEVSFTPKALLDDFNQGVSTNAWGVSTGTVSSIFATCNTKYVNDPAIVYGGSGYSLQLDYDVTALGTYAAYYSKLMPFTVAGSSLTKYTAVSFYVRGLAGGEFFKIQLKNSNTIPYWDAGNATHYFRNAASVFITDYLDGGVTTTWKKVTIPFDNFVNLDAWTSMTEFDIVFENSASANNNSPKQGTIYIDNITFETDPVNTVRIDHFGHKGVYNGNDVPGACALGGGVGVTAGNGTITAFADGANYYIYKYGMRLEYDVTQSNSWASTYLIFGGGNTDNTVEHQEKGGWIAIPHDFSAYNYLTFAIKANSDTENPKVMKIELVDGKGTRSFNLGGITTDWWTRKITLDQIPGLDKATIKQIDFVFVNSDIGSSQYKGAKTGKVFIDSVQFTKE